MKKPTRLMVALRAFFSILRQRPHVFCDEQSRSVLGVYEDIDLFQRNITDLFNESVETQVWMKEIDKILKDGES